MVSTHSRAEAAADLGYSHLTHKLCFNTQPRGGGCTNKNNRPCYSSMFQHTAARRRLPSISTPFIFKTSVSTHSRAEAAATSASNISSNNKCFNTQPRGGGCFSQHTAINRATVCFNTQPRGGGCSCSPRQPTSCCRFNTQPRGGGCERNLWAELQYKRFQHTAARRRLHCFIDLDHTDNDVSTHSRAEAAACNHPIMNKG